MARKLAIALIDAARILQVLVTVVLVGEHFAAAVTRVAVFVLKLK